MLEFPTLKASVIVEEEKRNVGGSRQTCSFVSSLISLARNEFRDIILRIEPDARKNKASAKSFRLQQDNLTIFRKFVKEGKSTVHLKKENINILISNAPPNQLVVFLKSLASKLAGNAEMTPKNSRTRILSALAPASEDISPVTVKDVKSLAKAESENKGILNIPVSSSSSSSSSPLATTPKTTKMRSLKRKRISVENSPKLVRTSVVDTLTPEQKRVLEAVGSGRNIFFTGAAGTGKSYVIRKIIGALPPDCTFVTASTGVAAYQIGGITLHSFAGIGSGNPSLDQCIRIAKSRKGIVAQWRKCSHLIVDEISMIDGKFFEKLEAVARSVRGNDRPFGGIHLILSGDFLQLPPVCRTTESRKFCFESLAWNKCKFECIELKTVKRQTDDKYAAVLRSLRFGICSERVTQILKSTFKNEIEKDGILATKLCTHSSDVDLINRNELAKLTGESKIFTATDSVQDPILGASLPVDSKIELKVGCQVMLTKNLNVASGLVNGARGVVSEFNSRTGFPIIRFKFGEFEIGTEKWIVKTPSNSTLTRQQLPLRLAWAFSIHKSQGMTLDCVEVSLSRVFEVGQAYVALSRAKDLTSLRILDFHSSCVKADKKVVKFYRDMSLMQPVALGERKKINN